MKNLEGIKRRFLKNDLPTRLGCIAADLARIKSFSRMANNQKPIQDLIEESKFFIEWTAPKASLEIQQELVNVQVQLALWAYERTEKITKFADKWSKRILDLSGLIKRG